IGEAIGHHASNFSPVMDEGGMVRPTTAINGSSLGIGGNEDTVSDTWDEGNLVDDGLFSKI
ncbi:hypothetical protein FCV25MIE_08097, partial [Fagus crenata]